MERGILITHPLATECDGASVCSEPETEGGGRQEAGRPPEFSRTRDRKNTTRTLTEKVVGDQDRVRANHRRMGWFSSGSTKIPEKAGIEDRPYSRKNTVETGRESRRAGKSFRPGWGDGPRDQTYCSSSKEGWSLAAWARARAAVSPAPL